MQPLLSISGLKTYFFTDEGIVKSVDGVSFNVGVGETVGIVGESGCGKSVTSLSIMGLIHPGRIVDGSIVFEDSELTKLKESQMRRVRGNQIGMIFQEPMTSLNPAFTIGNQISEALRVHLGLKRSDATKRAIELLEQVGIPRASEVIHEYPHQLSGGMRQRVMIAIAMACRPRLLIADEPTTALDVTIQAQILDLMRSIQQEEKTSILLITHDLGVVAEMCTRVYVMYAGRVVEEADVLTLFESPLHPYTQGLLASIPKLNDTHERLSSIPGNVPTPFEMPQGCKFAPRCSFASEICHREEPTLLAVDDQKHHVRCWLRVLSPSEESIPIGVKG